MKDLTIQNNRVVEFERGTSEEQVRARFPAISESEIKKFLAMLFTGLKFADRGEVNSAMALEVYALVLRGKPQIAVEAAVRAFLIGVVPEASRTFVPSTGELAAEVERQFWLHVRFKKDPLPEPEQIVPAKNFKQRWLEAQKQSLDGTVVTDE